MITPVVMTGLLEDAMAILELGLLIGGVAGLAIGRWGRPSSKVSADHGSVAVGGDANAPISVTSHVTAASSTDSLFWQIWNIASGIASFLGLALTLWSVRP